MGSKAEGGLGMPVSDLAPRVIIIMDVPALRIRGPKWAVLSDDVDCVFTGLTTCSPLAALTGMSRALIRNPNVRLCGENDI